MLTIKLDLMSILSMLTLVLLPFSIDGQEEQSIFDVMSHEEVLHVTLEADFAHIDTMRRSAEKHKAKLSFQDITGAQQQWDVKLKTRGNYRRMNCTMPPLKINFKKKDLVAAGLSKFDDFKLVTHCVSNKSEAKALIAKEYLGYKLYNELTDFSYRVQLLKITYKDTSTGNKSKYWAFLIEDTAELKSRIGATETVSNPIGLPRDTFHDSIIKIVSLYQYLIGNSDWDVNVGRNVKFVRREDKVIPIPYDFDFSGLVSASYAIPNPNYDLASVQSRIFLGFTEDIERLKSTISYFKTKRRNLLKIIDDFNILSPDTREYLMMYLDSFFVNMDEIIVKEKLTPKENNNTTMALK